MKDRNYSQRIQRLYNPENQQRDSSKNKKMKIVTYLFLGIAFTAAQPTRVSREITIQKSEQSNETLLLSRGERSSRKRNKSTRKPGRKSKAERKSRKKDKSARKNRRKNKNKNRKQRKPRLDSRKLSQPKFKKEKKKRRRERKANFKNLVKPKLSENQIFNPILHVDLRDRHTSLHPFPLLS